MARKPRATASTGIYHVILRGINKQDIFLEKDDFRTMLRSMQEAQKRNTDDDSPNAQPAQNCTYYAYCILHNHVHILLKEGELSVSEVMKRIQNRFVRIYNDRYERVGHLFQDRFLSEPVDNVEYFFQLIRYIHRNPVKAMEAQRPEDYPYSSWREYLGWITGSDPMIHLCNTDSVVRRFGKRDIVEWVNMDVDDKCMDMDSVAYHVSDSTAWEILQDESQTANVEEFKQLSSDKQLYYISLALAQGISLRQASRLSSLSYSVLWRKLGQK